MTLCIFHRYYLRKDGVCIMRMVDAEFEYTYEYQGNAPKLVHTPLTDKCYLTLTQGKALFLSLFSVSGGINHHGGIYGLFRQNLSVPGPSPSPAPVAV